MKTKMLKNLALSILSVLIVSSAVYGTLGGWEGVENAATGESLSATVWNSLVDGVVKKTGSIGETITGVKTFSSSPISISPTASGELATKGYVDNVSNVPDYDSGWVSEHATNNHSSTFNHNFGVLPSKIVVYLSTANDGSWGRITELASQNVGQRSPENHYITTSNIVLQFIGGDYFILCDVNNLCPFGNNGIIDSGYIRILAWR